MARAYLFMTLKILLGRSVVDEAGPTALLCLRSRSSSSSDHDLMQLAAAAAS